MSHKKPRLLFLCICFQFVLVIDGMGPRDQRPTDEGLYSFFDINLDKNEKCSRIRWRVVNNDDDVIKWKHFRVTGHLCGEFTGHR